MGEKCCLTIGAGHVCKTPVIQECEPRISLDAIGYFTSRKRTARSVGVRRIPALCHQVWERGGWRTQSKALAECGALQTRLRNSASRQVLKCFCCRNSNSANSPGRCADPEVALDGERFGVRRIPALLIECANPLAPKLDDKAPECGALQNASRGRLRLGKYPMRQEIPWLAFLNHRGLQTWPAPIVRQHFPP